MALLVWQDDLNIGIDVIDQQHRRIIEMLNHLHVAQTSLHKVAVAEVIDELVDYTMPACAPTCPAPTRHWAATCSAAWARSAARCRTTPRCARP